MNKKTTSWWVVLMALVINSCQLDQDIYGEKTINMEFPGVDVGLWPYFQRFEEEALKRNIKVDLHEANITGYITDISNYKIRGQCSNSDNSHQLTIDKPSWNNASESEKEFLVFHELGHCYLGRVHDESMDSKGICLSIMRSGTGECRDMYNTATRTALIDELFGVKN